MKNGRTDQEHRFRLSRKLLIKMLASCLLLTMLPLLLNSLLYRNRIRESTIREEQTIAKYLDYQRNRYDEAILELNKVLLSVLSDSDLLSVSILENPMGNTRNQLYRFVKAQKQIGLISKPYDFLDELFLLNMRRDVAISSESTYLRMDLFAAAMEKKYHGYIWPKICFHLWQRRISPGSSGFTCPPQPEKTPLPFMPLPCSYPTGTISCCL